MKQTVLVESSNNHYTEDDVTINDRVIEAPNGFSTKHAEHEPLQINVPRTAIRRVVECDPMSKKLIEVAD